jgi:lysophospholipid acyltransferase (LPLAT)-like uncharacterized protein
VIVPSLPKNNPSAVFVPRQVNFGGRVLARLLWIILSGLAATVRFRWKDESGAFETEPDKPVIFCIWHNRLALSLILYRKHVQSRWPRRCMASLVSASRDGGMLARVMELFGVRAVRGSSSRRGAAALREAAASLRSGCDLSITPDGPRGPCYSLRPGIVSVAQLTGCRIVPVAYRLSHKLTLNSWDRFQVPLPFTRCDVTLAPSVQVPRKLGEEEAESIRADLEATMRLITRDD